MAIKLTGLTLKELKLHRAKVDSAIQKREANNLARARAEAKKLADEYGVSLKSLVKEDSATTKPRKKPARTTKKVPPKYRHPDDASLTWTGRGIKPKWVVELLENGVKLEDLEIK